MTTWNYIALLCKKIKCFSACWLQMKDALVFPSQAFIIAIPIYVDDHIFWAAFMGSCVTCLS